ncbi:MAG: N-acetylmuramoyl-L-alanine amidase [Phyllobacteriaceae bacterium]|nr:N-acetylmuramoyl-L-alanine amidase [Phyllobacteriaceae bacterium]
MSETDLPLDPFVPDAAGVAVTRPSPNHGERRGRWAETGPDLLLLHYTGMPAGRGMSMAERAIRWLTNPVSEVSAHYVVGEDGTITQLVSESRRAWHAGRSSWAGETDVNSASIGIEIAHPGHWWDLAGMPDRDPTLPPETHPGYGDFPERQIAAVIALARDVVARHRIPADRVLAHSDVAPGRKRDPGEKFPWKRLAEAGVGLWVRPVQIEEASGRVFAFGEHSPPVAALQALLAARGYGVAVTGEFDATTRDVVEAFQRHHRPARVDGVADPSTLATLRNLLDRRAVEEVIA